MIARIVLLVVVGGAGACSPSVSDHDNRIYAMPASAKLSAVDLSQAYAADARAAGARYDGRVLEISGVVISIGEAAPVLMLGGADGGPQVEAALHEDAAPAIVKTVTAPAQRVILKCFCQGLDGRVSLKSCVGPTADH